MTLEIRKPELEVLIEKLRETAANIDELVFSGLNAIDDKQPSTAPRRTRAEAAAHRRETRKGEPAS